MINGMYISLDKSWQNIDINESVFIQLNIHLKIIIYSE